RHARCDAAPVQHVQDAEDADPGAVFVLAPGEPIGKERAERRHDARIAAGILGRVQFPMVEHQRDGEGDARAVRPGEAWRIGQRAEWMMRVVHAESTRLVHRWRAGWRELSHWPPPAPRDALRWPAGGWRCTSRRSRRRWSARRPDATGCIPERRGTRGCGAAAR